MSQYETVSRHMLRRTARERLWELEWAQSTAMAMPGGVGDDTRRRALKILKAAGVSKGAILEVMPLRGRFGWRVARVRVR
jgi:hypothetical protein